MEFASLGSGSKGNATLVRADDALLMIDCGFSQRQVSLRMERLGVSPQDLDAILVTHEHSDHISGVAALSRNYEIPVYMTHGTHASGRCDACHELHAFNCEQRFRIADFEVHAVSVPHDAAEPCQYRVHWRGVSLGVLTDLGSSTGHVLESFRGCDALLLEFNHDLDMLHAGAYPEHLKHRVGGDWGHLNNEQAVALLRELNYAQLRHLVVAHVSERNNSRELTRAALRTLYDSLDHVVFAEQGEGFGWLPLV